MIGRRVRLTFPPDLIREPIIAQLVRRFDVTANIRRADIDEEVGWIVCELDGEDAAVEAAVAWMIGSGVDVDYLDNPLEG